VLLALVGKDWTNVADRDGRRLDDPVDLVDLLDRRGARTRVKIMPQGLGKVVR
jgi:hypothetical protein